MGSIRALWRREDFRYDNLLLYYAYPVMNIEEECRTADGLGPMEFKPFGLIYSLLPAKSSLRDSSIFGSDPPKVEITSPSGFYERILWDTGPVAKFCFRFAGGALSCHTISARRLFLTSHIWPDCLGSLLSPSLQSFLKPAFFAAAGPAILGHTCSTTTID